MSTYKWGENAVAAAADWHATQKADETHIWQALP